MFSDADADTLNLISASTSSAWSKLKSMKESFRAMRPDMGGLRLANSSAS